MIGIIGFGVVGQALFSGLINKTKVLVYDKFKRIGSIEEILQTDAIFICLPTPSINGMQDLCAFDEIWPAIAKYEKLVIIKSTIIEESIRSFNPGANVIVNPEFLNQNSAESDFLNQRDIILGGRRDWTQIAEMLYRTRFESEGWKYHHCSVEEAIQAKYIHNIYHAYKVLFWNYVYEITGNHQKIGGLYSLITGNKNEMMAVAKDGKLGFGGNCFPKDLEAWDSAHPHLLTHFMREYNVKLRPETNSL